MHTVVTPRSAPARTYSSMRARVIGGCSPWGCRCVWQSIMVDLTPGPFPRREGELRSASCLQNPR